MHHTEKAAAAAALVHIFFPIFLNTHAFLELGLYCIPLL